MFKLNMGVMSCLGQRGLHSRSDLVHSEIISMYQLMFDLQIAILSFITPTRIASQQNQITLNFKEVTNFCVVNNILVDQDWSKFVNMV